MCRASIPPQTPQTDANRSKHHNKGHCCFGTICVTLKKRLCCCRFAQRHQVRVVRAKCIEFCCSLTPFILNVRQGVIKEAGRGGGHVDCGRPASVWGPDPGPACLWGFSGVYWVDWSEIDAPPGRIFHLACWSPPSRATGRTTRRRREERKNEGETGASLALAKKNTRE